ncbi:hypothetical protein Tco_0256585 [Tanacetum coccineum]
MKGGAINLCDEEGNEFIINKQRVKSYQKDISKFNADDDVTLDDEGGNFSKKRGTMFLQSLETASRIFPDGVTTPAHVIFDEKKPGSSLDSHVDDSWMTI